MRTSACPITLASRLLMSSLLIIMTSHDVTHSVILRPKWFPYFRDSEDSSNHPGNHSRHQEGRPDTESMSEEELRNHLRLRAQLDRPSTEDMQRALNAVRAANCTTAVNTTTAECYYRYTSLLLRILQRNFYDSVSR